MKFFRFDGPFHNFMGRIFDLVLLHLLWVLCSLPVITIGASTSALLTVTLKMAKNEEAYIVKSFWKAFKSNLKQGTKLWIIVAGVFTWLILVMKICMAGNNEMLKILAIPNAGLLVVAVLALMYVFPIQAMFENSVGNILKNSLICSLRYLPYSILLAGVIVVPILLTGFVESIFPFMVTLWIFGGSSLIAFADSFILNRVFAQVIGVENVQADIQSR